MLSVVYPSLHSKVSSFHVRESSQSTAPSPKLPGAAGMYLCSSNWAISLLLPTHFLCPPCNFKMRDSFWIAVRAESPSLRIFQEEGTSWEALLIIGKHKDEKGIYSLEWLMEMCQVAWGPFVLPSAAQGPGGVNGNLLSAPVSGHHCMQKQLIWIDTLGGRVPVKQQAHPGTGSVANGWAGGGEDTTDRLVVS